MAVYLLQSGQGLEYLVDSIRVWHNKGGVAIISYDYFSNLAKNGKLDRYDVNGRKMAASPRETTASKTLTILTLLLSPDIVVLDEGHKIANSLCKRAVNINRIETNRRIILTGTPFLNCLTDLHSLFEFVRPGLLPPLNRFLDRFVKPCKAGCYEDSTKSEVRTIKQRLHVFHGKVAPYIHRKSSQILKDSLREKKEYVLSIKLGALQTRLYLYFHQILRESGYRPKLIAIFRFLQPLMNHPMLLRTKSDEKGTKDARSRRASHSRPLIFGQEGGAEEEEEEEEEDEVVAGMGDNMPQGNRLNIDSDPLTLPRDWWIRAVDDQGLSLGDGGKLTIALHIIKSTVEDAKEKILFFSQSLGVLNMLGCLLTKTMRSKDGTAFEQHRDFDILTGASDSGLRQGMCNKINSPNSSMSVLLISVKVLCEGCVYYLYLYISRFDFVMLHDEFLILSFSLSLSLSLSLSFFLSFFLFSFFFFSFFLFPSLSLSLSLSFFLSFFLFHL